MGTTTIVEGQEFSSLSDALSNYEKIIKLLKTNSGITTAEICRLLGVTRNTVAISLARLDGAGKVNIKKVGMAKIYSLKPDAQTKLIESEAAKIKRFSGLQQVGGK